MAQELSDKIRAAAQARGIDPEIALRIARAESAVNPAAQAKTSSAGGLFQVVDKTWREFGGKPGKKYDPDENIRVGTDIIAKNTQTLKSFLNRDPRPAEVYAAHYFGPSGAKNFLSAEPGTPMESIFSKEVIRANPNLKGKTTAQVMASLEKKMGGKPVQQAKASPSAEQVAPAPARAAGEPGGRVVSAAPAAATVSRETISSLGPGYQAALALSFLADTDEKEDRDIDREPGIAEKWLAESATASRPSALAEFSDISIKSPFAALEPRQPVQMFNEGGEVDRLTPQQIERLAEKEAMEREAASKPAFLTPKSGIGRRISTQPGELEAAALQGVSEYPYLLAGSPVDLATMVMRPFGYDVEKPMFGSEDLKERALKAGIRQKPPEGAAARALYEMTQLGASAVNPAAPIRGAIKAAEKTGEAAKMLAKDFQQYNQQISVPGASYAVRAKGTPFVMGYGDTRGPDGTLPSMDQAEKYVRELATTNDQPLNNWFTNKITPYLRRDFASPEDQFVQAADKNMLLHLAPKPTKRDPAESASQYDRRMNLQGTRKMEGFPEEGVATTPYGKRVEAQIDESAWPAWLEDITSPGLVPPSMRGMVDTNPSARVTELGSNIDKKMKFEDLRDGMIEMRQLGPEYSAYGQAPVKVPKEYLLTDESLRGLTPAQASNRVATFRNWRDDNRQRMATKYAKEDPSLDRVELPGGVTAVQLPDLQSSPNVKQLALDVGCDGNWCTQREASALDYGSGNNRLHILVDKKARPLAQITFSKLPPTKKQLEADPSAGDRFSITEMLGKDNSADFSQSPALPALQQYIKSLDRQHGLAFVANLDKINMKELGTADLLKGAKELSDRRQRYQPGISPEEYMAATQRDISDFEAALYELNGGSKYLTKDQDMNSLVQQTLDRLAPQKRATGGMIERQSTDNRRYL